MTPSGECAGQQRSCLCFRGQRETLCCCGGGVTSARRGPFCLVERMRYVNRVVYAAAFVRYMCVCVSIVAIAGTGSDKRARVISSINSEPPCLPEAMMYDGLSFLHAERPSFAEPPRRGTIRQLYYITRVGVCRHPPSSTTSSRTHEHRMSRPCMTIALCVEERSGSSRPGRALFFPRFTAFPFNVRCAHACFGACAE